MVGRRTGKKKMAGRGRNLVEVLSQNKHGEAEENYEKLQSK
jgi:hypothetical protein